MRVLVYGAGAVGLGLASFLLKDKQDVYIVGRIATVQALKKNGLKRTGLFGDFIQDKRHLKAYPGLDQFRTRPFDYVLVCVKSFDSEFAARDLADHQILLHPLTKIILCQNGWGNAEFFLEDFGKKRIYNARIITGFTRTTAQEVNITVHADSMRVGSLFSEPNEILVPLCESITRGGLPCAVSQEIQKDLWAKMLYNCALNPLGAIYKVPYGVLGEHGRFRAIMEDIVKEIFVLMKAEGFQTHWPDAKEYLKTFYAEMLPRTAGHLSSTLQDIAAKKRTEIDALNGIVVKLAQRHHLPMLVNKNIYEQVKAIEGKERAED